MDKYSYEALDELIHFIFPRTSGNPNNYRCKCFYPQKYQVFLIDYIKTVSNLGLFINRVLRHTLFLQELFVSFHHTLWTGNRRLAVDARESVGPYFSALQ